MGGKPLYLLGREILKEMEKEIRKNNNLVLNPPKIKTGYKSKNLDEISVNVRCYSNICYVDNVFSFFINNVSDIEQVEFHFSNGTRIRI